MRAEAPLAYAALQSPGRGPPQGGLPGPRPCPAAVCPRAESTRCWDACGGRPRRGQRLPVPCARRAGAAGWRAAPALRPWRGVTCALAAAVARRVVVGAGELRPEARPRSPVGLGRGPPPEASRVDPVSLPPPARASGCMAPSSPTSPSPAAAGPTDSRR